MSRFLSDLDGTTKSTFSIAEKLSLQSSFTPTNSYLYLMKDVETFDYLAHLVSGPIEARSLDGDAASAFCGGMKVAANWEEGLDGANNVSWVHLKASETGFAQYSLTFPATAPAAGTVSLLTAQGENLGFVPLATLAAGAVKVEKKIVQFASGDNAWVTLPPQAEIWRLRMAIKTQYAGFSTPPRLTLGVTGNLTQFLDVNFASIDNSAGTIIDLAPKVMEASGAELVVGFTGNGATAGQLALYCEYMIPNV